MIIEEPDTGTFWKGFLAGAAFVASIVVFAEAFHLL